MTPDNERIDLAALAQRAREMRGGLAQVSAGLAGLQITGHGGGGLVTATVSGEGRLVDLQIDSSVIDPDDPQTLAELVIAAVDDAQRELAEQRVARMGEVTNNFNGLLEGLRAQSQAGTGGRVVPRFPDRSRPPLNPERGPGQ